MTVVDVWRIDLTRDGDANLLDDAERARAASFARDGLRGRFVASHAATRSILARYLDSDPAALRFDRSCERCGHPTHGKPRVAGVRFSLSHTGDVALLAVSRDVEVGVDVEHESRATDADGIVAHYFSAPERDRYESLPPKERRAVFLRWWVRKEAVSKAIGMGIALGLDKFDASDNRVELDGHPRLAVVDIGAPSGYVAALAAEGDEPRVVVLEA